MQVNWFGTLVIPLLSLQADKYIETGTDVYGGRYLVFLPELELHKEQRKNIVQKSRYLAFRIRCSTLHRSIVFNSGLCGLPLSQLHAPPLA